MDLKLLKDFVNEAYDQLGKYKIEVTLVPEQMMTQEYDVNLLEWNSVLFDNNDGLNEIPDDKRGIYAFAVSKSNKVLPPHGYILYIGIAGKDSNRSLRERYKDYLNARSVLKREGIAKMIVNWHKVLYFYFAPVDENITSEVLKKLEKQLNTALIPPFSINDLEADVKKKKRAFP